MNVKKTLAQKLPRGGFARNVLTLVTGTTIAQAIPIAISPILTRIYSPDDFGVYAIYISIVSIVSVVATGNYELAIMLPEKDEDAKNIVALSILITFIISGLTLIIVFIFNKQLTTLLNNQNISKWLYFVPLTILLVGIYQALNYWFNRKKWFTKLAYSRVNRAGGIAGTNLLLGMFNFGASGLVLGNVFGQLIANLYLCRQAFNEKIFICVNKEKVIKQARKYIDFPKYSVGSGWLNSFSIQIPIFILSSFFGSTVVGWYSISHKFINMPMSLIGRSVAQVYFQKASEYKSQKNKLQELTLEIYSKLLLIGIVPIAIIISYGDYVFSLVFGSDWLIAGQYAQVLGLWILFVFVSSPISQLFSILEKQKQGLIFNFILFISRLLSLLVGTLIFKDSFITVTLFGITGAVVWMGHCMYLLGLVNVSYKYTFLKTLSISLPTIVVVLVTRFFIFNGRGI